MAAGAVSIECRDFGTGDSRQSISGSMTLRSAGKGEKLFVESYTFRSILFTGCTDRKKVKGKV